MMKLMSNDTISMQYRDADLARRIGEATALEVRASGAQYAFSPCVAVSYIHQNVIIPSHCLVILNVISSICINLCVCMCFEISFS